MLSKPSLLRIFSYSFCILLLSGLGGCASNKIVADLQNTPQNALVYANANKNYTVKPDAQKQLAQHYLSHYFSPWTQVNLVNNMAEIQRMCTRIANRLIQNPGWGANQQRHTKEWAMNIAANANLTNFPNLHLRAIMVMDSDVRTVPTVEPSFTAWNKPGHGYPFDNLQTSYAAEGTPILVLHISRDGNWYLIATPSYVGWVKKQAVALVSPEFIKTWETGNYIVPIRDDASAFDNTMNLQFKTRVGMVLPLYQTTRNYYQVYTPVPDRNGNAVIKIANLSKQYATPFPMLISPTNVATVANALMGHPYGWGGLYGYRDCSSTMQDIMTTFGIWLPRNSKDQSKTGYPINMQGLTNKQKRTALQRYGIPFLTLVHLPGHIVLYLGKWHGELYFYQDMWGLRTGSAGNNRAVVGMTVVTPVSFGRRYMNVVSTTLDAAIGMTVLISNNALNYH